MVTATRALNQLKPAKILVIGDFMLDTYTTGDVSRISPEAPVPILHVKKQLHLPGGAGNVAINLQTLGAEVITIGRIGADDHGVELSKLFKQGLFVQKGYQTPGKNRLMSEGQQIIRVDEENNVALSSTIKRKIIKFIHTHCHDVSAIAISDYNKGLLTKSLLGFLIEFGMKNVIPIIVDPKGVDFTPYMGATLIKPNLMEACAASKLPSEATLDQVGESLLAQTKTSMMLITRSSEGMSLFTSDKMRQDFAIKSREVKDVTGAGDTVLAMITLCLANDIEIEEGIYLANIAAGIAVEKVGCHRITLAEVTERILEKDHDSKIFNKTELFSLQRALENKPVILVQMKSKMQLSANLYQNLKKLVP
ncbi:MAG: HldE protein, partial [Simkaniaceae bacterium]|nr:HldE protein [Simkaniaceae bacterium]